MNDFANSHEATILAGGLSGEIPGDKKQSAVFPMVLERLPDYQPYVTDAENGLTVGIQDGPSKGDAVVSM